MVPLGHLEGCSSIECEPNHWYFNSVPNFLAFYNPDTGEIKIGPASRFNDPNEMLDTITHEIGHNAHHNLIDKKPITAEEWSNLFLESDENEFVTWYASTNEKEDFAESYKTYIQDPMLLQFISPKKYEFMRENVFR